MVHEASFPGSIYRYSPDVSFRCAVHVYINVKSWGVYMDPGNRGY